MKYYLLSLFSGALIILGRTCIQHNSNIIGYIMIGIGGGILGIIGYKLDKAKSKLKRKE